MPIDKPLERQLFYLIEKANKVAKRYTQEIFGKKGLDITVDQWLVMKKISDIDRIKQNELADILFKDKASITRILDLLIQKDLVRKTTGDDKRVFELELTKAGKQYVALAYPHVKAIRRQGMSGLTEKELDALMASLQKIIDNLT
jgi:MarR family transcriptional regulator, transcriptional regulator for hemolysin